MYPATLLNLFLVLGFFSCRFLGIFYADNCHLQFFPLIYMPFILFSFLTVLARTCNTDEHWWVLICLPCSQSKGKSIQSYAIRYTRFKKKIDVPYHIEDAVLYYYFSSNVNMNGCWNSWNTLLFSIDIILWFLLLQPVHTGYSEFWILSRPWIPGIIITWSWCIFVHVINFSFSSALATSHNFDMLYFHFYSVECIFKISLEIIQYSKMCLVSK